MSVTQGAQCEVKDVASLVLVLGKPYGPLSAASRAYLFDIEVSLVFGPRSSPFSPNATSVSTSPPRPAFLIQHNG